MTQKLIYLLVISLTCCTAKTTQTGQENKATLQSTSSAPHYSWTKILDSAEWSKSYNFQMFSIGDTIWTFHPDGNWFSTNGSVWIKSELRNAITNIAFLDYVHFNDAIYGLGNFQGNIEQFKFKSEIYKSNDFKQWQLLAGESNLPERFFYHPFVFKNKLWIIGGEDKNKQYADIWNSDDGVTWTKQKDNLAFGKRSGSQVVQLKEKLYLMNNDVWSSTDGLNWQLETNEIIKGEKIFGYAAIVYDEKIWLLGCNRNGEFLSQVLVSTNGKDWTGETAPWTPRGGIAATVYKGKIYMTGGKYGGTTNQPDFQYSNDLWTLERNE